MRFITFRAFYFLAFIILSCCSLAWAQNVTSVAGQVNGPGAVPLEGAFVVVLKPDSSFAAGGTAAADGSFKVEGFAPGLYILKISYIGYAVQFRSFSTASQAVANVGTIALQPKDRELNTITIEGKIPPVVNKGDTLSMAADAYKVNKDASTEDLLTKMPGIQIVDGKVQAQGENVKQVLVDGKPFFGNDPSATLKNLPAEVVDKIEIFDRKSDQSSFTGFDDGNTSKTINVITKVNRRNGMFGRAYAGYGTDDRYKAGLSFNKFKGPQRISILAQANNINEQNFSMEDLVGAMGGGGGAGRGGAGMGRGGQGGPGADIGSFFVDQKNGISTSNMAGINFSDNLTKKLEFSGSYFYNNSSNVASSNLLRSYVIGQRAQLKYREAANQTSDNLNHRLNFKIEYKIDSLQSLLIQPRFTFQRSATAANTSGSNSEGDSLLNESRSRTSGKYDAYNVAVPILYRLKLGKPGRTISLEGTPQLNTTIGSGELSTQVTTGSALISGQNQATTLSKSTASILGTATYTEPIAKGQQVLANFSVYHSEANADKKAFDIDAIPSQPSIFNPFLSNTSKSRYTTHSPGIGHQLTKGDFSLTTGLSYQWAHLENDQTYPGVFALRKDFTSLLPSALLQYKISENENLRARYRTSNNAPSVSQLQEVLSVGNPLQLSTGNFALRQDYTHNFFVRYSRVAATSQRSFFGVVRGQFTQNYIGNQTIYAAADTTIGSIRLPRGGQLTRPVNLDGYASFNAFLVYSLPLKSIKSNLNLGGNVGISRTPSVVNSALNINKGTSLGSNITLSSNLSPQVDFTLSANPSYNIAQNTLQSQLNNTFFSQRSSIRVNIQLPTGLVLTTDGTHTINRGLSSSFNQNFLLLNAGIGYKFLKDKALDIRLTAFDILKQNRSIARTSTDNYIEDTQNVILRRYYLLTATYTLRQFKGGAKPGAGLRIQEGGRPGIAPIAPPGLTPSQGPPPGMPPFGPR